MTRTATTDIAVSATAVALLVQVTLRVFPELDPLVCAFAVSMFLATARVAKFWKMPVEWLLSGVLILASSNGGTSLAANIDEYLLEKQSEQASAGSVWTAYAQQEAPPEDQPEPPKPSGPRIIRW